MNSSNQAYIVELEELVQHMFHHTDNQSKVIILPITPWGNYVQSLNAALLETKSLGLRFICYQVN